MSSHESDAIRVKDLDNWFTYHPPKVDQPERYAGIRNQAHDLALVIQLNVPAGPERTEAIKKLREAVMWANAGIACNE